MIRVVVDSVVGAVKFYYTASWAVTCQVVTGTDTLKLVVAITSNEWRIGTCGMEWS